jgi:hypothetical protein
VDRTEGTHDNRDFGRAYIVVGWYAQATVEESTMPLLSMFVYDGEAR